MFTVSCRALATVGLLAVATVGLSACNTVSGMGQDASALGHDVTRGSTAAQGAVANSTGASTH